MIDLNISCALISPWRTEKSKEKNCRRKKERNEGKARKKSMKRKE